MCEVSTPERETPCAWALIVERCQKLGTLDRVAEVIAAKDWSSGRDGGPRRLVREDLRLAREENHE